MRHPHNRLVSFARGLVVSLFRDAFHLYAKKRDVERDQLRLLTQLDQRGARALLVDLPAFAKHFNKCLDEGTYTRYAGFLGRPKRSGEQVPVFLRELFLRIFSEDGRILDDPCADAVFFLRTITSTWKTLRLSSSKEDERHEVDNFFRLDGSLRSPTLRWDCDDLGVERSDSLESLCRTLHLRDLSEGNGTLFERRDSLTIEQADHLQRCFDIVASGFGLAPHLSGVNSNTHHRPRNGPGVVAELQQGRSKYEFPYWPAKLQRLFPRDEYALPSFGWGFSRDRESTEVSSYEHPSRLIAVPKTLDKPRLIAAEPSAHQWVQQYLWQVLEDRVERSPLHNSIRFRDQKWNQEWARLGSIDGSKATIDLSEASDRLTCFVVERFFRRNPGWIEALHACRTRWLSYGQGAERRYTRLRKFSTMGSTVIFPLQSIIYATVAIAASLWKEQKRPSMAEIRRHSLKVRVFGDDIIVDTSTMAYAVEFIEALGLKVNEAKTFSKGNFRESCGLDAFRGFNVTPPRLRGYPDGTSASLASLVESSNNFHKAGLWYTAKCISDHLRKWHHAIPIAGTSVPDRFIPAQIGRDVSALGFFSFVGGSVEHLKRRWNTDLQRDEYRIFTVSSKKVEGPMSPRARLLQYFTEAPAPTEKWKSGFALSRTVNTRTGWVAL